MVRFFKGKDSVIRQQVQSVQFGFYTDDDVRERSVIEITSSVTFDPSNRPSINGLYDTRMGPISRKDRECITCNTKYNDCTGHTGHIELVVPVLHPLLILDIINILRCKCFNCHNFRSAIRPLNVYKAKLILLIQDRINELNDLDNVLATTMQNARRQNNNDNDSNMNDNKSNKAATQRIAAQAMDVILDEILNNHNNINIENSIIKLPTSYHKQIYTKIVKETITMLKAIPRCTHCGAFNPKIRHDSFNKIFQNTLSKTHQRLNAAEGIYNFIPAIKKIKKKKKIKKDIDDNNMNVDYDDESDDDDDEKKKEPDELKSEMDIDDDNDDNNNTSNKKENDKYMNVTEIEAQVQLLYEKDPLLCNILFGNIKKYFIRVVAVPPNRFRPPMYVNGTCVEHVQTSNLIKILNFNNTIRNELFSSTSNNNNKNNNKNNISNAYTAWINLQTAINIYMDSSKDPIIYNQQQSGIRQILERKEGLFRKNMMGKRVDYACRSVISPDPYIGTNEIGIPRYFAQILTYPTIVNEWNVNYIRNLILNTTADSYPTIRWIDMIDKYTNYKKRYDLSKMNNQQHRYALAGQLLSKKRVIVGRQLRDGDYVLMNRQPTLHKPGIMAHRVRILHNPTQKTIRMHYANCNTYNADFDGDEMNCHFPQSDLARAEAQYIAQTDLQYIVPTDGSPLRGLIQDHVVGGVKLTKKDTFLEKWEYQQLVFSALTSLPGLEIIRSCDNIETVPPAIIKPRELWTGKQVITTLLLHLSKGSDRDSEKLRNFPGLSLEGKATTPDSAFKPEQQEHLVLIRDGELLRGVLDKASFGAKDFSLVHGVYEAYGPEKAGLLLNALGRLFTAYIQFYSGHSCRMEDLVLTKESDAERKTLVQRAYNLGSRAAKAWADSEGGKVPIEPVQDQEGAENPLKPVEAASAAAKIGMLLSGNDGKENFAALDGYMQGQLNPLSSDIVKKCLPDGLAVQFPYNSFSIMTTTGAKGSIVNQSQVTCALGQQALEGRRVPRMSSGRTLPSFAPYDPNPRADGFVMDRFLTGIRPQEYYFHCMAGREGLVDTAVKTSRSGYLQRCLVKHLEDLKVCYDHTVRNSENNVIMFLYGEDGLDPTKASYLDCTTKSFEYMARNFESLSRHNTALPAASIDMAVKDAVRDEQIKSGNVPSFRKGDVVSARRVRTGNVWLRGKLCRGWNLAIVQKFNEKYNTVDLKYVADGVEAHAVPVEIDLSGAGGQLSRASTSRAVIVKPAVLDPIISSAQKGHRLGSSGACISERVAKAASDCMSNRQKLGQVMKKIGLPKEKFSSLISAKFSSSICAPGEAVGSIAAQSVGEPSTQMTLNTFHLAGSGANVTLGIPRLREIIMTASRELKTPTMSVPLHDYISDKQAVRLARDFQRLTLMDLISGSRGISVTERLEKAGDGDWLRAYYVTIKFYPAERIKEAFGLTLNDIASVVAKNFVAALSQLMKKELRRSAAEGDEVGDVRGATSTAFEEEGDENGAKATVEEADELNEEEDDDDMDDAPGEEDGVKFNRKSGDEGYDDGQADDDDIPTGELSDAEDNDSRSIPPTSEDMEEQPESFNEKDAPIVSKKTNSISLQALRVEPGARPLLMVGLVEAAASRTVVRSCKKISEAFINDEPGRGRCLQTAGINFEEIWSLETVDHTKLMSNDIWAIRCAYGVEAARNNIVEQIRSVFGVYGIEVNPRHLSLIADFMTFNGGFKPMSRTGMADCSSAMLQMSFETTATFMQKAAMLGAVDDLESPSANIVVGRPVKHGTGSFSLMTKTSAYSSKNM